jgi:peptidoglycan/xylan/chitin deacetylase (PgdA/CDA1 family)
MHKVVSDKMASLATGLTITVDFLDHVLARLKDVKAEFVTLDEMRARLDREPPAKEGRPFIALTFDDGFRDNLTLALPVLRRYRIPATVYVPSGAPDRNMDPWPWRLDKALRSLSRVSFEIPGLPRHLSTRSMDEKRAAFRLLTQYIHQNIPTRRHLPEMLMSKAMASDECLIAEQFLSWDELRKLDADPLITIGGHTMTHASLCDLREDDAMGEIERGRQRLAAELDTTVAHFAYPYSSCGPREFRLAARAGFATAVTGFDGNIFLEHRRHMMSLPRRGLGGSNEAIRWPLLDFSGTPTALGSRWRNPIVTL